MLRSESAGSPRTAPIINVFHREIIAARMVQSASGGRPGEKASSLSVQIRFCSATRSYFARRPIKPPSSRALRHFRTSREARFENRSEGKHARDCCKVREVYIERAKTRVQSI